jgi:hypothetical protein
LLDVLVLSTFIDKGQIELSFLHLYRSIQLVPRNGAPDTTNELSETPRVNGASVRDRSPARSELGAGSLRQFIPTRQLKELFGKPKSPKFALGLLKAAEVGLGNQCDGGARRVDRQRADEAPIALCSRRVSLNSYAMTARSSASANLSEGAVLESKASRDCSRALDRNREKRFNMVRTPQKVVRN